MNLLTKVRLLGHIARWLLTWRRRDTAYRPAGLELPKFMSAREAVALIPDGATVVGSGMAASQRATVLYWAIQERWRREGHPAGLTWVSVGAQGGRGRVPGTMEELGAPGLITRYIMGHLETQKAFLKLGDAGLVELHTMPQGELCFLLEAQMRGEDAILSSTGLNSFCDPTTGRGSRVSAEAGESFITREGDQLRYRLPRLDVAVFSLSYADVDGNVYATHAALFTEAFESAMAVHRNGGRVIVCVGGVIPKNEAAIFLPTAVVDAIVVNPRNEQTCSVPQRKYWPMFAEGAQVDMAEAIQELKFINDTLRITPVRREAENALARLAAARVLRELHPGAWVNIGVGLPEEVGRILFEQGLAGDLTFVSETGVIGGLPAPGIFFGASINPREIISSAALFHRCKERLEVAIFGQLQVDSRGNVNVSQRGPGCRGYVGPGGFPTMAAAAKTLFIVGAWQDGARFRLKDGKVSILRRGTPKFVAQVDEVTFNGQEALKAGKRVFFVTSVGLFRLTSRGMELCEIMPGLDLQRDVLDATAMRIVLPENGEVPVVDAAIVTGIGYTLGWT
jgi:propionate CoA-transferase